MSINHIHRQLDRVQLTIFSGRLSLTLIEKSIQRQSLEGRENQGGHIQ